MTKYGARYLSITMFQSYCAELKIRSKPSESNLELYEREGILLPVARIIKPDEYVIKCEQTDQQPETYGQIFPEWVELERLLQCQRNDADMWHTFDREFEKENRFLLRPKIGDFEPWKSFKVEVTSSTKEKYNISSVQHYYHYWQAYIIDEIQSDYPVFARHNWLLENLNDEAKEWASYYKPTFPNQIYGTGGYFDALSFFIELYTNEEYRTFAPIVEIDGYKQLTDEQLAHYHERLKKHARFILQKFDLNPEELYQFLINILQHQVDYRQSERLKLAEALGNDAIFLTRLIYWGTGKSVSEIEDVVGKQAGLGVQQQFRHLDKALEIYDYARDTFERLGSKYNNLFPDFNITTADIDRLLKFIEDKHLFIIPYAISDIHETLNNPKRFRSTLLYGGLSNLTTGFECFLREIANIVNRIPGRTSEISIKDSFKMINGLFNDDWGKTFEAKHKDLKEKHGDDSISYIQDVLNFPKDDLDRTLRAFLIAHQSRNYTAHNYIVEHYFYHYLYSISFTEICISLFYSWKYASRKGWV